MGNATILLLEDDFGAYQEFRRKLFGNPKKQMITLHSAITIEGAKKLLKEIGFNYIFLNKSMGEDLAQWMAENNSHKNAKIIYHSEEESKIEEYLRGFDFQVTALNSEEFIEIVEKIGR